MFSLLSLLQYLVALSQVVFAFVSVFVFVFAFVFRSVLAFFVSVFVFFFVLVSVFLSVFFCLCNASESKIQDFVAPSQVVSVLVPVFVFLSVFAVASVF